MSDHEPHNSSPSFGKVFWTTGKVILALCLISAVVGVIALIVGGGMASTSTSSTTHISDQFHMAPYYIEHSNNRPSTVPSSQWKKIITASIKAHCALGGMTKEEVEKSLGKPQKTTTEVPGGPIPGTGEVWIYESDIKGKCLKYSGDACIQNEMDHKVLTLQFTPEGRLAYHLETSSLGAAKYNEWDLHPNPSQDTTSCFGDSVRRLTPRNF
jgi:hypothetical protein